MVIVRVLIHILTATRTHVSLHSCRMAPLYNGNLYQRERYNRFNQSKSTAEFRRDAWLYLDNDICVLDTL